MVNEFMDQEDGEESPQAESGRDGDRKSERKKPDKITIRVADFLTLLGGAGYGVIEYHGKRSIPSTFAHHLIDRIEISRREKDKLHNRLNRYFEGSYRIKDTDSKNMAFDPNPDNWLTKGLVCAAYGNKDVLNYLRDNGVGMDTDKVYKPHLYSYARTLGRKGERWLERIDSILAKRRLSKIADPRAIETTGAVENQEANNIYHLPAIKKEHRKKSDARVKVGRAYKKPPIGEYPERRTPLDGNTPAKIYEPTTRYGSKDVESMEMDPRYTGFLLRLLKSKGSIYGFEIAEGVFDHPGLSKKDRLKFAALFGYDGSRKEISEAIIRDKKSLGKL